MNKNYYRGRMSKRIELVDIAKCLGIFLMIFGHSGLQGYPHNWIYAFHMPFFFLTSGLFLKADYGALGDVVKKNCRQLLVPYVFFYILTIPFGLVYIYFHGVPISTDYLWKPIVGMFYGVDHLTDTYSYFTNGPLWFLLALFWARILFATNRVHKYSSVGIVIEAVISFILYRMLDGHHINIWSIAQAFMLYPFLCVGYFLNRKWALVRRIEEANPSSILLISTLALTVVSAAVPFFGIIEYGSLRMGNMPLMSFAIAIVGSVMMLTVSKLWSYLKCRQILNMGGGTLTYLAIHHPIMDVVKFVFLRLGYNVSGENTTVCVAAVVMTIVACYPCLLMLNNYCPKLIGK